VRPGEACDEHEIVGDPDVLGDVVDLDVDAFFGLGEVRRQRGDLLGFDEGAPGLGDGAILIVGGVSGET
jgi:hypothetical protein